VRYPLVLLASLIGVASSEIVLCRQLVADEPKRPLSQPGLALPARVEEILWWLPVDTQTIVVDQGLSRLVAQEADGSLQVSPPWPPTIFREGSTGRQIAGRNVILRVEGARRFRRPRDLGLMPYEGATVAVLERGLDRGLAGSLHEGASRTETIEGTRVSMFRHRYESDDWTLFVCQPKPDVLIGATHRGYLADLLKRMKGRAPSRALPADLPEWKHIDRDSPFWAIRHYDQNDAGSDPTSPLGRREGWYVRDDEAVGLVFNFDPPRHKATVIHLTKSKDVVVAITTYWQNEQMEKKPQVRQTGPGVVEISATPGNGDPDTFFWLLLSAALGHAVCL